ncbi:disks large homolog 5-like isoform X3 [Rattus norvegicus]|uniref:disks large homolog 5-like isoform X3 n=1 Tax=Rattus norvegicus TaxID=10116 RepID=UPI0026457F36
MFSHLRKRFGRGIVDSGETRVKESGLSSQSNGGQRQDFWGMSNAGRETSSPGTDLREKQAKKEKERLIEELHLITEKRNDLRDRLRFLTERSMKNRPYFRPNPYYEDLERMEEAVMSILHNLEMENTVIHENNQKLKKEITFSRNLLSQLLMENTCRKKLVPLKQGARRDILSVH